MLVGAQYQTNPFCVMSLHNHLPMHEPKDLIGKTVGYGPNMAVPWFAWLSVNGIKSKVKSLLTTRDATILTSGGCDAYVGWVTSDVLGLVVSGEKVDYLLFGDTGLKLFDLTYCVSKAAAEERAAAGPGRRPLEGGDPWLAGRVARTRPSGSTSR